jgi:hypothetical protein
MSQPLPKYGTAARFERSTVDMAVDRPILEQSGLVQPANYSNANFDLLRDHANDTRCIHRDSSWTLRLARPFP